MALAKAIKFRNLSSQLNQSEMRKFVTRMINQTNNVVVKALFAYFIQTTEDQSIESEADVANQMLSQIIASRKKKPSIDSKSNLKLDRIPKQLIGATASFLEQDDYIDLSKTNRSVYLGCNAPNLMQQLDLRDVADYSSINLASYRSVKRLQIDLNKFNEFSFPRNGMSVLNKLNSVVLYGRGNHDIDINPFMADHHLNIANTARLKLSFFGSRLQRIEIDKVYKILSKFPKIQHLELVFFYTNATVDGEKVKALCPEVKSLRFHILNEQSATSLINAFGHQLEQLDLNVRQLPIDLSQVNFDKLQGLKLCAPTKTFDDILNTAKNLKLIEICNQKFEISPIEAEKLFIKCLSTLKSLESIKFDDYKIFDGNFFESVLIGIEKGLFQTKSMQRKKMKIELAILCPETFKFGEYALKLGNIIHWMKKADIKDFMLILHFESLSEEVDMSQILEELEAASVGIKVWSRDDLFFVTNKNCNLTYYEN